MMRTVLVLGTLAMLWELVRELFVAWYSGAEYDPPGRAPLLALALRIAFLALLLFHLFTY